jgi:hypothetical protein
MVTGELPFRSLGPLDAYMKKLKNELPPPRKLVPALSERVDSTIRRAMSSDPAARQESCREFLDELSGTAPRKTRSVDVRPAAENDEIWYIVYQDENGAPHTVKGTAEGIRRSMRDGLLGDATSVRVSKTKAGPFQPVRNHPYFRSVLDTVVAPAVSARAERPATGLESPPSRPATRRSVSSVPRIPIDIGPRRIPEWAKYLLVGLAAMISGMLVYRFLLR